MKKLISFLFLCTFFLSFSQQKNLSIEDAVLGYYKGLYPTTLNGLQWVSNTHNYVYQKENNILFSDAKTNNVIQTITLEELQKTYSELKRLPRIQEINSSNFTFLYKNFFMI